MSNTAISEALAAVRDEKRAFLEGKDVRLDSGCKVGWAFFKNNEDAQAFSPLARREGDLVAQLGYDFGYQSPGQVVEWGGEWRVTTA